MDKRLGKGDSTLKFPVSILYAASFLLAAFILFCEIIPLGTFALEAIGTPGFLAALLDPSHLSVVRFTALQALISTAISIAIGLPLGIWIGRFLRNPGAFSTILQTLLAVPYGVPTVVAGMAWIVILGRTGIVGELGIPLDWAYSANAVVLAHVFFNAPWIALFVAQARAQVSESEVDAAKTLGAADKSIFFSVTWPQIKWVLFSASSQTLALCVTSFALVLILGGGPPVETLETMIYSKMRFGPLDLPGAMACAAWQLALTLPLWIFTVVVQTRRNHRPLGLVESRSSSSKKISTLIKASSLFAVLIFVLPYFSTLYLPLLEWSQIPAIMKEISKELLPALRLSVTTAGFVAIGSILIGACGAIVAQAFRTKPRITQAILIVIGLPSGISILVMGLGFWMTYRHWIDPFEGSWISMILLQIVLFSPLAIRQMWALTQQVERPSLEAAATLGATPTRAFFDVEWPRWRLSTFSLLGMITAVSLGEVAALSLFYSERLVPLPLLITRAMGRYRFEEAQIISAFLLLLSTCFIGWISLAGTFRMKQPRVRKT